MLQKQNHFFQFEEFRLDVEERRLWKSGEPVMLPPKVFDLLTVLVEHHGRLLDKAFLMETLWPESFIEDANLAVNVSTLRKALGEPSSGGRLIETVPKRGYRFVGSVTEVPRQLGEPLQPLPEPPTPVRPRVSLAAYLTLGLVAGIVIGFTAWWVLGLRSSSIANVRKIAVLPFKPLSGDASQDYLGLGMADALITRLSRVPRIVVTPTGSILRFANRSENAKEVGRELTVDAVLEGRVQHSDGRIRLTVNLLSAQDGRTLWAENFDDVFTNIFAVQDSISEKVASALEMKLTGSERQLMIKRSTANTEAYSLYMLGQYQTSQRTSAATLLSIDYFRKAIEKDPNYAAAYAALALGYVTRASWGWGDDTSEQAKSAARKALALDNDLSEAHLAMGQVLMRLDWDWQEAAAEFDRAIEINPNSAAARAAKSILDTALSRRAEALDNMELACKLDPSSAFLRSDLAWTYYCQRRFREALANAQKAVELGPNAFTAHRELGKAFLMLGRYQDALSECEIGLKLFNGKSRRVRAEMAQIYALSGQKAEAEKILDELKRPDPTDPEPTYLMGVAEANLGDKDTAFQLLDRAVRRKHVQAIWMNVDPEIDSVRSDPRFTTLVRLARLAP